ncbi:deoxyribodipyrimidine photo-lyase [Amycolatopsis viridis]|uniref:Deoxyribodipyrimidine photo-lyase n=1 Tax=Amycolatopsis viridis TaxID=185678 RepID=A0ABX0SN26_9PSEU|nr:deoxyribodipyrimidine photo-lyase [Amycolatopsis viridis]NIH78361.1 deoxyribodipyrimidine photo-lyase [Amycolatopsis viridis]
MGTALLWFRRDLRLADLPALACAAERASRVLALYVLDDALLRPAGEPRRAFLHGCLEALAGSLDGRLLVVHGDPVREVPRVAHSIGAGSVHVSTDTGPYGRRRDRAVAAALDGVDWVECGSPYAVTPGRLTKPDGQPYRVFSPFYRAWRRHGWPAPAPSSTVDWIEPEEPFSLPPAPDPGPMSLPRPGEAAAQEIWRSFVESGLDGYAAGRDRPDRPATTRLSPYLRWGCLHPRTMLADLGSRRGADAESLRSELAWREFYADVLYHRPETARQNYDRRFDRLEYDTDQDAFDRWRTGRTGYPIVDAGMRQLLAEGWMHNRVRMIVASFLVKDLHLPWWLGARHFMRHLVDGDLASNQLNWQWVAGTGTDPAPFFRIFNPTTQGEKFDPDGDYVRRYVPELREIPGKAVHQPWKLPRLPTGYPRPIVDHAHERTVALDRYNAIS